MARIPFLYNATFIADIQATLGEDPAMASRRAMAWVCGWWVVVTLVTASARADECRPIDDAEVQTRLARIERALDRHEPDMRHWATGFLSLHLAMTGVQVSLAITADSEGAMVDSWVGTISSFLGVATLAISWPSLIGAGGAVRDTPRSTAAERRRALVIAEERLRRASGQVDYVRGPVTPLLNALYLGAAASFSLIGWRRITSAFLLSAGGSVLSQTRVLLYPSGIRDEWNSYHRAYPDAGCELAHADQASIAPSVEVVPSGLGFVLHGRF